MDFQLTKSFKGFYPFKLCTTSYIFPDYMAPNVERLAPYFDEIELLMFESSPEDVLPSKEEISSLMHMGKTFDTSFNVHLPIDINPCDRDPVTRQYAMDVVARLFDLTAPMFPSSYTLHLPFTEPSPKENDIKAWQERAYSSLDILVGRGIPGELIAIETLDYPIDWIDPVLSALDLSVCIDIGHLILYGFDFDAVYRRYAGKTKIIHLHGVSNGKDHISLDAMKPEDVYPICQALSGFRGTVSLEVFSFKHLKPSLSFLEKCWQAAGLNGI
jgi:adenosylcobalamin phosphodiesterase